VKLRAIRLKEVGRFRDPVALEGLSGGLDVLAGPNELGKSTILKAVRLALFEQYKSKAKKLEAFRPYTGGAPLVEVDFEIDGNPWRVRKQFLSAASAELKDLSGATVARGADAESRLAELLSGDGRFSLLWVEQGAPLAPLEPVKTAGGVLTAAIESEVETVSDGGAARAVQAQIKTELAGLVTSHNPPRPTGRYKAALDECQTLLRERDAARDCLGRSQDRLDQLQELRNKAAHLSDPNAVAQRAERAAAAKQAFDDARAAREACRHAEEAVRAQEQTAGALKATLSELRNRITDLGKLEEAESRAAPELAACQQQVADCETQAREARKRRDEVKAALAAAEKERKALELSARHAELTRALEAARAAEKESKALGAALAANGADESLIKAVRREAQSVATLRAQLSAAAPAVRIAYAEGGTGKIKTGGRPLKDGETLNPTQSLTLEIEGIGTITVAPGESDNLAESEADLAAHETQLETLLHRAGASSVDEAEAQAAERRDLEAKLSEAARELKAAAPEGVERLQHVHAQLAAQVGPAAETRQRTPEELEDAAGELMERLGEAEAQLSEVATAHAEAREVLVQVQTRAEQRRERIAALIGSLGDVSARKSEEEKQTAALAEAEAALNRVVRELAAWREKAPDDERVGTLKAAAETATAAHESAQAQLIELRRVEAGIEGELKADRADDVTSRVAELDEAHAAAAARLQAIEKEAASLQLLARELDAAQTETREHFAKPVIERLAPYLELVFPEATARFGEGLALDKLERSGAMEEIGRLSEGTQEQLAVLVRLGFGRLLAERGAPVPLILDDALVYADDRRIEQMFDALKLAARTHQVLVLTCRERTFASLGGNRVTVGSWQPD
jgi:chromosome segregation ATPase